MTQTIVHVPASEGGGAFDPTDITLTDNTSGAFLIKEGSNEYMRINTTDTQEKTIFTTQSGASTGFFVSVPTVGDVLSIIRGGSPSTKASIGTGVTLFQVDSDKILNDLISDAKTFKVDGTSVSPLVITGDSNTTFTLDAGSSALFKVQDDAGTPNEYINLDTTSGSELLVLKGRPTSASNAMLYLTDQPFLQGSRSNFIQMSSSGVSVQSGTSGARIDNIISNSGNNFRISGTGSQVNFEMLDDSNATFTLDDASGAVFKIVDSDSSPRTYFTATENGVVLVDSVKVGLGGGRVSDNVAVGAGAFAATQTGFGNSVAVGFDAGNAQTSGYNNTFVGEHAGKLTQSSNNNAAFGFAAMDGEGSNTLTGNNNTACGASSSRRLTSGAENTALGDGSLAICTTGSENVAIGKNAGNAIAGGSGNIAIGHESDCAASGANQIAIGNGVVESTNNRASIGDSSNVATLDFSSASNSWSQTSDVRIKENIQDSDLGLAFINSLRPVKHTSKDPTQWPEEIRPAEPSERTSKQLEAVKDGLIAQEVKAAADALGTSFSGWEQDENGLNRLQYERFVVPLIKAVQELSAKVEELKGDK